MTIFFGRALDLAFHPDNKLSWLTFLEKNDKKKLVLNVDIERAHRSLDQNAYLWGVVYREVAIHTGHTEEELHRIFKRMFLPPKFILWKGIQIKTPGSTAELNKPEFGEYIERIRAEVANLGITIPDPQT